MQRISRREERRPRQLRRLAPACAALIGVCAIGAPAVAQAAPAASSDGSTTVVAGDSVVVSSLPSFGPTSITVTRPDAITGAPVTIGLESGTGNSFTPFSANTITPTPLAPSGDCWQAGALSEALTPDIQPGDTVTVTQAGFLGGAGTSDSTTVQPSDEAGAVLGPIAGCASIAPWAQNAITSAPGTVASDADLTVSGVAQPLATGVSVSASDGATTTSPVSTTPAADGSWSVTIPASALAGLAAGPLTVTPVMAVPDVSTGAPAHIAGVGATVTKSSATSTSTGSGNAGKTGGTVTLPSTGSRHRPVAHVTSVRAARRVSLAHARKHGVKVSFVVPAGVKVVQFSLLSGSKRVYRSVVKTHRAGARQTLTLPAKLARRLHAGKYMLAIKVGTSRTALGGAITRKLRLT
jgi:hypothetical protein